MSIESEIDDFSREIDQARLFDKRPPIFSRGKKIIKGTSLSQNELFILRRWNSHTPVVHNVFGGGYFLFWKGKGTVIDPGCSFIRLFELKTRHEINDIDLVITSHDHIDHCQDLITLISLFRQYNKLLIEKKDPPKTWDLLMSYGVEDQINSMLINKENVMSGK